MDSFTFEEKRKKDFVKDIKGVDQIKDPRISHWVKKLCRDMCSSQGSSFPGMEPVFLNSEFQVLLANMKYKVSWKADGIRLLMLIMDTQKVFLINRDGIVFFVNGITFPKRNDLSQHVKTTLLDGKNFVGSANYDIRAQFIQKEIVEGRQKAILAGLIDREKEPFGIRTKDFWNVQTARELLAKKFLDQLPHKSTGLIFQPMNIKYSSGKCGELFKWKPPELTSANFIMKVGRMDDQFNVGYLYLEDNKEPYSTIELTDALRSLDNKILECVYDNNHWKFRRERADLTRPDDYESISALQEYFGSPVSAKQLLQIIDFVR